MSASWTVPADAVSGIYFAQARRRGRRHRREPHRLRRPRRRRHLGRCCSRPRTRPGRPTTATAATASTTATARGRTVRGGPRLQGQLQPPVHHARVDAGEDWLFNAEYPMVRWLERNGYDVSYFTGVDTDRRGAEIARPQGLPLRRARRVLVERQRANVERRATSDSPARRPVTSPSSAATRSSGRRAGSRASTARPRPTARSSATRRRTRARRSTRRRVDRHLARPALLAAGRRRAARERADRDDLHGQRRASGLASRSRRRTGKMRFWRNTPNVSALTGGQVWTGARRGTLGYEWDEDLDNGFRPAGLVRLSTATRRRAGAAPGLRLDLRAGHGDAPPDVPQARRAARSSSAPARSSGPGGSTASTTAAAPPAASTCSRRR